MPSKRIIIPAACVALALGGYMLFSGAAPVATNVSTSAPFADVAAAPRFDRAWTGVQSKHVLFSGAASNETMLTQQRHDSREKRMAQDGYGTPAEYYYLPLTKLKELASTGDVFALIQLGQQYLDERDAIASEAGFDASAPPNKLAADYFALAVMAGATQPALTLAARLADSEPAESYAWALFAEKLQLGGAKELASKLHGRLSERDIDAARTNAEQKFLQMAQVATVGATAGRAP